MIYRNNILSVYRFTVKRQSDRFLRAGPYLKCTGLFYGPFLTTSCGRNFDDIDLSIFWQIVEDAFFWICHTWWFIGYCLFEKDIWKKGLILRKGNRFFFWHPVSNVLPFPCKWTILHACSLFLPFSWHREILFDMRYVMILSIVIDIS